MSSAIHNLNAQSAGANLIADFRLQRTLFRGSFNRARFLSDLTEMNLVLDALPSFFFSGPYPVSAEYQMERTRKMLLKTFQDNLERATRIELATFSLGS